MLLTFDIGNTNIVLGAYHNGTLYKSWRMETNHSRSADEYGILIDQFFSAENLEKNDVDDIIISTVVPSILHSLQHMSRKYFRLNAIIVEPGIKTGLKIRYDNPEQLGSDRIVNAVGALDKYGGPLIVIDFGTATTFCALTEDWEFLGGTISPGVIITSNALFENTAILPTVELNDPGRVIGKNTIESMQSGLVYGHMGITEHIVKRMKKEMHIYMKNEKDIKVIATGGVSSLIEKGIKCIDIIDKQLTLNGLNIIYEKNSHLHSKK